MQPASLDQRFQRLLILFGVLTSFLVLQAAIIIWTTGMVDREGRELTELTLPSIRLVGELQAELSQFHVLNLETIFAQSTEQMEEKRSFANVRLGAAQRSLRDLQVMIEAAEVREETARVGELLGAYQQAFGLLEHHLSMDRVTEAFAVYDGQLVSCYNALRERLQGVRRLLTELSHEAAERTRLVLVVAERLAIGLGVVGLVCAGLSVGGLRLGRSIKELVQRIRESEQALAQKNAQVLASITYAQRIQSTILHTREALREPALEVAELQLPRDVVSGDFVWYGRNGDCAVVAVVDCTGHGVPGAFMSLVGHLLLDEVVAHHGGAHPAAILHSYHRRVQEVLRQVNRHSIQDGMDVALWIFDRPGAVIRYAGANRPLYRWDGHQIEEEKGTRRCVGGVRTIGTTPEFTEREWQVREGDLYYLTTDGLADQPNSDGKRVSSTRLKHWLAEVARLPLAEQKEALDERLRLHQGSTLQRDDITLVAIRIKDCASQADHGG